MATLAAEQYPDLFDGALAGCGPIGDFQAQLNHIGDFRVVFDYLFPGVIPGTAVDIPDAVRSGWESTFVPAIVGALAAEPDAGLELIAITGAAVAGNDPGSVAATAVAILWYDIFGIADAQARLGGQPFENSTRVYTGSSNDAALNAGVQRFTAEPAAVAALARFQTSGNLQVPLTTLHTMGDEIVPFGQSQLYGAKVSQAGKSELLSQNSIDRHGHCTFQALEVLSAFTTLIERVRARAATTVMALARP